MDKVIQYRSKHPRCRYCKYNKHIKPPIEVSVDGYFECVAKNKYLYSSVTIADKYKGMLCKVFESRGLNEI